MNRPAPTSTGRSVAGGTVVAALVGWSLAYPELQIVAVAGATALVTAAVVTLPRPRLTVHRAVTPPRVMRGDPARARVTISAPAARTVLTAAGRWFSPGLRLRDRVAGRVVEQHLPRPTKDGAGTSLDYDLPTRHRGAVPVGPVGVARTDPLGLWRNEVSVGERTELWVYPRVLPLDPLSSGRKRDLEGPTHERATGSITFDSLRDYVVGDDLRLVHWPSTARTGTLIVRDQVDPGQPRSTVVLDTLRSSYDTAESFEEAVDAAASVVVAATSRRFPVRLLTGAGLQAEAGPGRADGPVLLDMLARVEAADEGSLAGLTRRMAGDRGGANLVVITGRGGGREEATRLVEVASSRYESLAVVRFERGAEPGAARDGAVLHLVAADAVTFAGLWSDVS